MILYKKPKQLAVGGIISGAMSIGDMIGKPIRQGAESTDEYGNVKSEKKSNMWGTVGAQFDPLRTSMETFKDENATTKDKWMAGINIVSPNPLTANQVAKRNTASVETKAKDEYNKKREAELAKYAQVSRDAAANYYSQQQQQPTQPQQFAYPVYKNGGGLSRSEDYGSKSKPYPSVSKKDFAGGKRSYPIPTKADAIDALRLAGLHGRSDVRAKVYKKYPSLKKAKSKEDGGKINKDKEILIMMGGIRGICPNCQ